MLANLEQKAHPGRAHCRRTAASGTKGYARSENRPAAVREFKALFSKNLGNTPAEIVRAGWRISIRVKRGPEIDAKIWFLDFYVRPWFRMKFDFEPQIHGHGDDRQAQIVLVLTEETDSTRGTNFHGFNVWVLGEQQPNI
jgi:hypothetical protein